MNEMKPKVRQGKGYSGLDMCFQARAMTRTHGLNWLQDRGLISDNCVTMADVAEVDAARIVQWFREKWSAL